MKAVFVRVNDDEHQQIAAEAARLNISVSAFIRLLFRNWHDGIRFERDKTGADPSQLTPQTTNSPSDSAPAT